MEFINNIKSLKAHKLVTLHMNNCLILKKVEKDEKY